MNSDFISKIRKPKVKKMKIKKMAMPKFGRQKKPRGITPPKMPGLVA